MPDVVGHDSPTLGLCRRYNVRRIVKRPNASTVSVGGDRYRRPGWKIEQVAQLFGQHDSTTFADGSIHGIAVVRMALMVNSARHY